MTYAWFWHLMLFHLCFHVVFLPVVFPCESSRPEPEAADDYSMVISLLLQDTDREVTDRLNTTTCTEVDKSECEENKEIQSIINMVCRRRFKVSSLPAAQRLMEAILRSLNCPCRAKQKQRTKRRKGREKVYGDATQLCRLKVSLGRLKLCYQALLSRQADGT